MVVVLVVAVIMAVAQEDSFGPIAVPEVVEALRGSIPMHRIR